MAQDLLHLQQIDPGLDQVRGVAVAQAVGRNLFLRPSSRVTRARVRCTPPRSSGLLARWAPESPAARLGNSSVGWRWQAQKRRSSASVASGRGTRRSRLPLALRTHALERPQFGAKAVLRRFLQERTSQRLQLLLIQARRSAPRGHCPQGVHATFIEHRLPRVRGLPCHTHRLCRLRRCLSCQQHSACLQSLANRLVQSLCHHVLCPIPFQYLYSA